MSGLGFIGEGDIKPCLGFIITESDCFLRKYNCSTKLTLKDLWSNGLIGTMGKYLDQEKYLNDAVFTYNFTRDVIQLGWDPFKGIRYYKFLKMHFKSGAEIKAAFNNFVKNANKIRNLNDLKNLDKLKGNLGKLRKFWADISKPLDVEANLKQIGKLKLFGPAPLRWLGKFSPWMATTDAVNSGISAITNFVKGNAAEGFRDAGHALMAGAVILSATGAGAPVAAGVAVLGA